MNQDEFKKLLDEALEPIKDKQESHSAALVSIESKLDAYTNRSSVKMIVL